MGSLLLITIVLPLAGALACFGSPARARHVARATATATLLAAAVLVMGFLVDHTGNVFAACHVFGSTQDATPVALRWSFALDSLSVGLFTLTALLGWTALLFGDNAIRRQPGHYRGLLLLLTAGMLGLFAARDVVLFYVLSVASLIPCCLLIGFWSARHRQRAALRFMRVALFGSFTTLLGLLAIVVWNAPHGPTGEWTFSIDVLAAHQAASLLPVGTRMWIFAVLSVGFGVRVVMTPLRAWLPAARAEAPIGARVMLAGAMLLVGVYGFVRFCTPLAPNVSILGVGAHAEIHTPATAPSEPKPTEPADDD